VITNCENNPNKHHPTCRPINATNETANENLDSKFYGNKFALPKEHLTNDFPTQNTPLMDLMRSFCQEQIPGTLEHEVLTSYMNEKMQKVHEKKKKKPEAESPQPTEDIPDFNASYSNDHALRECWVSLGKNTYSALVDTGASHNLITISLAALPLT